MIISKLILILFLIINLPLISKWKNHNTQNIHISKSEEENKLIFISDEDTSSIPGKEFNYEIIDSNINIIFNNENILRDLIQFKPITIKLCLGSEEFIATSNHVLSASLPVNSDYHYPINDEGNLLSVNFELNLIKLYKIERYKSDRIKIKNKR